MLTHQSDILGDTDRIGKHRPVEALHDQRWPVPVVNQIGVMDSTPPQYFASDYFHGIREIVLQELLDLPFLEIPGEMPVYGQGDLSPFLRDDKGYGIRDFGDSKPCPVPGSYPP